MGKKRKIEIELEDVRRLGSLQCTYGEAAAFFKIGPAKFKEILIKFPEVNEAWQEGMEKGRTSLRRKQFRLANNSASMAIHLGKNILGQKDAQTLEHTGPNGGPIQSMDLTQLDKDERNQLRELLNRARKSNSTTR